VVLPGEVNIISYCALDSAPCRPVRHDRLALASEPSAIIFPPYALPSALCAMLRRMANFWWVDWVLRVVQVDVCLLSCRLVLLWCHTISTIYPFLPAHCTSFPLLPTHQVPLISGITRTPARLDSTPVANGYLGRFLTYKTTRPC